MKFIRVDMTQKTIEVEGVPEEYVGLGGRGLTSTMVNNEVPPQCDALGPKNKLIFAPGLLSGTTMVSSGRMSVGAKSPLTGGIKESNAGGNPADALARLGITALIVEGAAPAGELYCLKIDAEGEVTLHAAQEYQGMRTYALVEKILEEHGEENSILCIGPAGEYQLKSASIQTTDVDSRPCRAAARGGLGAVMGSKGLKAIVVGQNGRNADPLKDPDAYRKAVRSLTKAVKDDMFAGIVLPQLGTAAMVAPLNSIGAFPCNNATAGVFKDWERISGETMTEIIQERGGKTTHQGCSRCVIRCSNEFVDQQGKFVTSSLEYETIWSTGGMCGVNDLDVIARMDFLCDDIGLDTMNTGVAVATAMDAGYKDFGDGQAAMAMVEEVAAGTEFGRILGNGPAAVGEHFGHHRVAAVKNQSIAAYDPRGVQGMGVTYATSPMGGDHTSGNVIGQNMQAFGGKLDPLKADGQIEQSRAAQIDSTALDCSGLCLFVLTAIKENPTAENALLSLVNAKYGTDLTADDWFALGKRIIKTELEFNKAAGLTEKDSRLPDFFSKEPLPPNNSTFLIRDEELDGIFDF